MPTRGDAGDAKREMLIGAMEACEAFGELEIDIVPMSK